jgi:hypothetical protein
VIWCTPHVQQLSVSLLSLFIVKCFHVQDCSATKLKGGRRAKARVDHSHKLFVQSTKITPVHCTRHLVLLFLQRDALKTPLVSPPDLWEPKMTAQEFAMVCFTHSTLCVHVRNWVHKHSSHSDMHVLRMVVYLIPNSPPLVCSCVLVPTMHVCGSRSTDPLSCVSCSDRVIKLRLMA